MRHLIRPAIIVSALGLSLRAAPADAEVTPLDWLSITPGTGVVRVVLPADSVPRVFALDNPPRLVIDVHAVDRLPPAGTLPGDFMDTGIRSVRHAQFRSVSEGAIARIVLDLEQAITYSVDFAVDRAIVTLETPRTVPAPPFTVGSRPELASNSTIEDTAPPAMKPLPRTVTEAPSAVSPAPAPKGAVEVPADLAAKRAAEVRDRRAASLVDDAASAYENGSVDETINRTEQAIRHYPDSPSTGSANVLAADAFFDSDLEADGFARLVSVLRDGLSSDSDRSAATERIMRRRPPQIACPAYVSAVDLAMEHATDPIERARLGGRLGVHLAQSDGDLVRAVSLLEGALASKPNAPLAAEFHASLGYCHQRLKDFARAAKAYHFAHDLIAQSSPDRARELSLRAGDVWYRAGETAKAGKAYAEVAHDENASESDRSWALFQEANCHFRARRFDLAAQRYRQLLAAYPLGTWSRGARIRLALVDKKERNGDSDPTNF